MNAETAARLHRAILNEGQIRRGPVDLVEDADGAPAWVSAPDGIEVAGPVALSSGQWKSLAWHIADEHQRGLINWDKAGDWEPICRALIHGGQQQEGKRQ